MSNSPTSSIKFAALAIPVWLLTAAALVALWPSLISAARHESSELVNTAGPLAPSEASRGEALADLQLAAWLNPHNQTAYAKLATTQLAIGRPAAALTSLSHAGQGSSVTALRVRALIELGRYHSATTAAIALTTPGASDSDLVLTGLADQLAGLSSTTAALVTRVSSPEAAGTLARAQAGAITLGAALAANGLLGSSNATLANAPAGYERNLLWARNLSARPTVTNLNQSAKLLATALALNPAGLDARRLLLTVYETQHKQAAAARQVALIAKLTAGQP